MINDKSEERIGQRIKQERKKYKYSQDEMAEKCNCSSRQTYAKWEKGIGITLDTLVKLCEVFECDIGYLLCEYDTKHHVVADIQEQIGLSEQAISVLLELRKSKISTDTLSSLLIQPEIEQWLFQIYRIAGETYTYRCLKEKAVIERAKMDNPKITTLSEHVIDHIVVPEIENADLQEAKRHHRLIDGTVNDLCASNVNIQEFGENGVNVAINSFKAKYRQGE